MLQRLITFFLFLGGNLSGREALAIRQVGTLAGRVVDESGAPVPYADIVLTEPLRTVAVNRSGAFAISGIPSGQHTVMARAIGHHFAFTRVHVPPGDTGWVLLRMRAFPQRLAPVIVSARAEASLLPDFERRRRAGFGYFISRDEIEAANPLSVSQFLRRFPVIRIMDSLGVPQAVSSRGPKLVASGQAMVTAPCVMRVALDGQLLPAGTSLDFISPSSIGGIEMYLGPSTIPVEFAAVSRDVACGLVVLWTRRR